MLVGGVKVGERRKTGEKEGIKDEKKKQAKEFDNNAWKAVGQVVRMAEGNFAI